MINNRVKRLRVFAGPNGSGKSTLYEYLVQIRAFHPYYYINPDNIAKDLTVSLSFNNWPVVFSFEELKRFLDGSAFQEKVHFCLSELLISQGRGIALKKTRIYRGQLFGCRAV